MKQGHLFALFLTVYTLCFLALYTDQKKYDNVLKEKQRVEQALLSASYTAAESYKMVLNETEEIRKKTISEVFLEAFYVSMGLFESQQGPEALKMHIPLLVLAEEDGAFFYFMQEAKTENGTELRHTWSEKKSYGSVGENYILETIESTASAIVSRHNYIASQYGIEYQFHVPVFLKDVSEKVEGITLFVVFQGWPLTASGEIFYENCIDVCVYIAEKEN